LDPWPLDEDSTSKRDNSRPNLYGLKSIGRNQKKRAKKGAHDLKSQVAG
jgi:hypothetical protein